MDKAGLLIVDLQHGFSPSHELVEQIRRLSTHYERVVMTRFTNHPGSLYRSVLGWNGDGGYLVFSDHRAVILDKSGYGLAEQHLQLLAKMQCTEWHVCGVETDACVLACAFSLWDYGLRPIIRSELCESPLHDQGVAVAKRQFG